MALPQSPTTSEDVKGKTCPVTGASHEFRGPQEGDSRSPCPALNTMANHGYIPRNGKNISAWQLVKGLRTCYGLTLPFSIFLSYTTFLILRKFNFRIDLYHIGKHNAVEHDASLVHHDTPPGQLYAPIDIDPVLLEALAKDATAEADIEVEVEGGKKEIQKHTLLTIADVGRARVRRENQSPPLDGVHARIARGEVAIILGVWETRTPDVTGTRWDWLQRWFGEERLPDGWRPTKRVGMFETVRRSKAMLAAVTAEREAQKKQKSI